MTTKAREKKYQAIKLYASGHASLSDIKGMFRVVSVAATEEYSGSGNQKLFLGTKDRMDRLEKMAMTRDVARQRMLMSLNKPSKLTRNRAEVIADFAIGAKMSLPHNWERYGNLVKRTDRVNPTRKGSSRGKIGKTTYIGFKKFNKDFDGLMKALLLLTADRKQSGARIAGQMAKLKAGVTVSAKS